MSGQLGGDLGVQVEDGCVACATWEWDGDGPVLALNYRTPARFRALIVTHPSVALACARGGQTQTRLMEWVLWWVLE